MAQNSISYDGAIVSMNRDTRQVVPPRLVQSENGLAILELRLAEGHDMKKARAPKEVQDDPRNAAKGADEFVRVSTSWHKLTIFGDKALELAQNPDINHGALIRVVDASYMEDAEPFEVTVKGEKVRQTGRPETIGDKKGYVEVIFPPKEEDRRPAIWDGESPIPSAKGNGGGRSSNMPDEGDGF